MPTTGVGRFTHLTGELLQMRTGIKLLLVPYSGGPTHALNDVLGGRIPVIIEAYSGLAGAVQAGKFKPIAVGSLQRLPDFPDLPTVSETLPGFNAVGWQALVAPNGTPEAIVRKIGTDLRDVLAQPEVRDSLRHAAAIRVQCPRTRSWRSSPTSSAPGTRCYSNLPRRQNESAGRSCDAISAPASTEKAARARSRHSGRSCRR